MNFIIRLIISALAVMLTAWLLPGVHVDGFFTAIHQKRVKDLFGIKDVFVT